MRENIGRSKKLFHKNFPFHFLLSPANPWSLPGCSRRGLAVKTRNDRQKTQGNSLSPASPLPQTLIPTGFTHPNPAAPSTAPRAGIIGSFFEEFHFYSFQVLGLPGFSLLAAKFQRVVFFFFAESAPGDTRNPRWGWVGRDSKVLGQEAPVSVRKGSSKRASGSFPDPSPAPFSSES